MVLNSWIYFKWIHTVCFLSSNQTLNNFVTKVKKRRIQYSHVYEHLIWRSNFDSKANCRFPTKMYLQNCFFTISKYVCVNKKFVILLFFPQFTVGFADLRTSLNSSSTFKICKDFRSKIFVFTFKKADNLKTKRFWSLFTKQAIEVLMT